jgi:hypothetical protein
MLEKLQFQKHASMDTSLESTWRKEGSEYAKHGCEAYA